MRVTISRHFTSGIRADGAAQLLPEAVGGPFTALGAEAPFFSRDERRHAVCRSRPPTDSLVAASGVPREPHALGASPQLRRPTLGRRTKRTPMSRFLRPAQDEPQIDDAVRTRNSYPFRHDIALATPGLARQGQGTTADLLILADVQEYAALWPTVHRFCE